MTAQSITEKSPEYQALLREVKYRLSYRGTLELDKICRRFLPEIEALNHNQLIELKEFFEEGENHLMAWLVDGKPAPEKYAAIIKLLKT